MARYQRWPLGACTGPRGKPRPAGPLHTDPGLAACSPSSLWRQRVLGKKGRDQLSAPVGTFPSLQTWGFPKKPIPRPPPHPIMEIMSLVKYHCVRTMEPATTCLTQGLGHGAPASPHCITEEAETREGKHPSQGFKANQSGLWTGTRHQFVQGTETLYTGLLPEGWVTGT